MSFSYGRHRRFLWGLTLLSGQQRATAQSSSKSEEELKVAKAQAVFELDTFLLRPNASTV
jgi:hypothetical protein